MQNALQQLAINLHFLVVADANLGVLFFKEKCKSIANGQNGGDKHPKFAEISSLGCILYGF